MASEMASMEDIEVRTVLARGDVASAPPAEAARRRGVAGEYVTSMEIAGAPRCPLDSSWTAFAEIRAQPGDYPDLSACAVVIDTRLGPILACLLVGPIDQLTGYGRWRVGFLNRSS